MCNLKSKNSNLEQSQLYEEESKSMDPNSAGILVIPFFPFHSYPSLPLLLSLPSPFL